MAIFRAFKTAMTVFSDKRLSWVVDALKRAQMAGVCGSFTVKLDKGLVVGCKTEHNEKPPLDAV